MRIKSLSLLTRYLINRLWDFHQIHNFGAVGKNTELITFCVRKSQRWRSQWDRNAWTYFNETHRSHNTNGMFKVMGSKVNDTQHFSENALYWWRHWRHTNRRQSSSVCIELVHSSVQCIFSHRLETTSTHLFDESTHMTVTARADQCQRKNSFTATGWYEIVWPCAFNLEFPTRMQFTCWHMPQFPLRGNPFSVTTL